MLSIDTRYKWNKLLTKLGAAPVSDNTSYKQSVVYSTESSPIKLSLSKVS